MVLLMLLALTVLPTLSKNYLMVQNVNVSLVFILLLEVLVNVQENVIAVILLLLKTPKIYVLVRMISLELNALLNANGQTWMEQHLLRLLPKPKPPVLVKLVSMELNAKMNANPQKIKKLTVLKTVVNVKILIGLLRQRN